LQKILAAILNDPDFFEKPVLKVDPQDLEPGLRPAYILLQRFFRRLSGLPTTAPVDIGDEWKTAELFLEAGAGAIKQEWEQRSKQDAAFRESQQQLYCFLSGPAGARDRAGKVRQVQKLFFPEGLGLLSEDDRCRQERLLRNRRAVAIGRPNDSPIADPAREILFTSNILVTVPLDSAKAGDTPGLRELVGGITPGAQKYWYDHPIPIGIAADRNEALYGMRGLDRMMAYEKESGHVPSDARLTCLLSASTTHDELHAIVKDYFELEFRANGPWENLDLFLFSETDCRLIVEKVLEPLVAEFMPRAGAEDLLAVFGVDGEYGRHYSFLKAVAAFWQVFIDPQVKATFKIDLDQVFDQQALVRETGHSALEHFKTALWGAEATDNLGRPVRLGMIAGALVNHDDIAQSLFTPDVKYPEPDDLSADELIFCSRLPQALSTAAEMMCRYDSDGLDGISRALQRVHVTGGTNGILIEALRAYRPFTPSVIGRAEDQAYLMSVLFGKKPHLRYLHKPGLIMRHDQQVLAGEAVQAASVGKMVGDYVRILQFSYYARALPWPPEETKALLDPFTGCFITALPFTVVYLRFAFKIMSMLENGARAQALEFMKLGSSRLLPWIRRLGAGENPMEEVFNRERRAWNLYYDLLDLAEGALARNHARAGEARRLAAEIIRNCRLSL